MNDRMPGRLALPATALLCALAFAAALCRADDDPKDKPPAERRVEAGTCTSGTLFRREAADRPWQAVPVKGAAPTRDTLLALPGTRAAVRLKGGAAEMVLWGNLPELSEFPVLESAVVLYEPKDVDLDLFLDRGRVVLANRKDKGEVRVRLRFAGEPWELVLARPGTRVAVELSGRWPAGVIFSDPPKRKVWPTGSLALLVLEGSVRLSVGAQEYGLTGPPGPALFSWDSVAGPARGPVQRREAPAWAAPEADRKRAALVVNELLAPMFDRLRKGGTPEEGLAALFDAADRQPDARRAALARRLAVDGYGALDDLPRLLGALGDAKHADAREAAVNALRHWLGRSVAQPGKLYQFLVRQQKYPPGQAAIVVQLLHSFGDDDLRQPQTYDLLTAYLRHARLPIRELARWHLYRLVPAGRNIKYDPAGTEAEREKAYRAWKKLIPDGQVPKD